MYKTVTNLICEELSFIVELIMYLQPWVCTLKAIFMFILLTSLMGILVLDKGDKGCKVQYSKTMN